jgi:glycosyltransferase involved in cell wall biosynthesis
MKIAYIVTRIDEIGGAQIHVKDVARRMAEQGHDVAVISGRKFDPEYLAAFKEKKINVYFVKRLVREINFIDDVMALSSIIKILKRCKPDLISLHASKAGFLGRVAGKLCGIPTLFTAHGWSFSEGVSKKKAWFYICAEKLASYMVKRIINVCYYDTKLALRYKIAPAFKFTIIHNGMPELDGSLSAAPDKNPCRIVMTARFAPPKDHVMLFSALKNCADLHWHLDLIGTGPLEQQMKSLAEKYGITDRVTFHGQTHRVAEILGSAQIFVLITNWEGLPRSIIEALRAGLPVVASNVGGIAEMVRHGKNGFLISRADGRGLASYLRLLLEDAGLRLLMGKESRRIYEKEFIFENMFEKTLVVYKELLYS